MRRRHALILLAAAGASPLAARAQTPGTPVIGFLSSVSPRAAARLVEDFRRGLNEEGFVDGHNLWIHYRWAEGHYNELPALASDLVERKVSLIAATGGVVSAQAARQVTSDIPILFVSGFDPVQLGLVTSLNQPGGNLTGVSVYTTELASKRLELLHELLPAAQVIAVLVNPGSLATNIEVRDMSAAADHLGLRLVVLNAATESEIDGAFAALLQQSSAAFLVSADPFFTSRRAQIVALAKRNRLPGFYPWREYAASGGLISYGTELTWAYKQIGIYAGRILKGAKVTDLPVQLPTTFDLVINLTTAKALGINPPLTLLGRANEVIE